MPSMSAAVVLVAAVLAVQAPPSSPSAQETRHLTLATSTSAPATGGAKPARLSLLVDVTPKPKMHVYAPGQSGYITIALALEADPAFTAGKARYPAGEKIRIEALKETQIVYAKPFQIAQDITLKQPASGLVIKGTVRYQACDDTICYLPTTVPVQWTVNAASK